LPAIINACESLRHLVGGAKLGSKLGIWYGHNVREDVNHLLGTCYLLAEIYYKTSMV